MSSTDSERAALLASARAYLEWELELSGFGVPSRSAEQRRRAEATIEPVRARGEPAAARLITNEPAASAPTEARAQLPSVSSPSAAATERSQRSAPPVQPSRDGETPDIRAPLVALPAGVPVADRRVRLQQLEQEVQGCSRCELAKGRTRTVFARGNPESPVVFIGEGPGQEEDRVGLPFVGPAGQLLDRMIAAMGYGRDDVYICNIVKCRPPGNRTPLPSEAGACSPYLLGQLEAVAPQVIVALGRCATENLGLSQGGGWRGRWGKFRGIDVMPTYHPAFLLRSPEFKRPVWEDLQKVMQRLKQAR